MSSPRLFKQLFSPTFSALGAGNNIYATTTAASNNVVLPTGTINVTSTFGFPSSGQIGVQVILNNSYAIYLNKCLMTYGSNIQINSYH